MFGKSKTPETSAASFDEIFDAFEAQLDSENLKYTVSKEDHSLSLCYDGDNFKDLYFVFIFDDDGTSFALRVFSIEKFGSDILQDAYEFCNKMNAKYRWAKVYVDEYNELTIGYDGVIDRTTVGPVCIELLHRLVSITEEVCEALHE